MFVLSITYLNKIKIKFQHNRKKRRRLKLLIFSLNSKEMACLLPLCPARKTMAFSYDIHLSNKFRNSFASSLCKPKPSHALPKTFTTPFPSPTHFPIKLKFSTHSVSVSATGTFTWDDVVRISQPESVPDDSSDLSGFSEKVKICNRGSVIFLSF